MNKLELLTELEDNTYIMLRPSPIAGIGIFVVQDIDKGCRDMFSKSNSTDHWIKLSKKEVEALPLHAKRMVENYCLYDEDHYFVPDYGFKKMDISLFLNHSETPNILSINDGEYFEAIRDIKVGEELLIDYGTIVDGE
jgi:SET domain-containing protein